VDKDALINEICKRVKERLDTFQNSEDDTQKPKILVLTEEHGTICHEVLECPVLGAYYQMECALLQEYQCDMDAYEAVIAFTMSNESLGKIANGIFDGGYTRLFGKALLSGKKIYLLREEVELYKYREQAPVAYYQRLLTNLKLLQDSGVVIAPQKELQSIILTGAPVKVTKSKAPVCEATVSGKELIITKHVITEKDITTAHTERAEKIVVNKKAILTDLAREYAHKRNIAIERREISSARR